MSSTIKVNNIQNLAGDDSGIDLSTNDQIILKTANTTAITVDSSQNVALAGNQTIAGTLGVTGNITGGGMDLLYTVTSSSSVSAHDISSTYINSTYNNYYLVGYFEGDADTRTLKSQVFVGGVVQTGSIYGNATTLLDGSSHVNNNSDTFLFHATGGLMGGEDGEGTTISVVFHNANNTQAPFSCNGSSTKHSISANHDGSSFSGSVIPANRANVVNGIRFVMNTGNINYANFKLYGLRD